MTLDLHGTLERDGDRARDVLRDLLGGVSLVREDDAVYAEIETTHSGALKYRPTH